MSLAAIQPTVRAPGQRVGNRAGVLHAKAGQQDFRVSVWDIVAVAIRIEEQVRRLQDEHTTMTKSEAAGQVQPIDKILGPASPSFVVEVVKDGDPVIPLGPSRRRLRHPVVDGSRIAVNLDSLETGGVRILQVLDDPQAAAIVEFDGHRLPHHRLAGNKLDLQAIGQGHAFGRLVR